MCTYEMLPFNYLYAVSVFSPKYNNAVCSFVIKEKNYDYSLRTQST